MIAEGSLVVVYLKEPREKYWGRLQAILPTGAYLRGMDLNMVESWARELARGEEATMGPTEVFFPLARVEKVFLDEKVGYVRSVQQQFEEIVGREVEGFL